MSTTRSASPPAPATDTALLLCAHGARGVAGAASAHAQALDASGRFAAVEACALYGEPELEAALDHLSAPKARLVPFMMAEGYTLDTLRALTRRFPQVRFVWLMGADNLMQVDRWADWPQIFHTVPVAVLDRPSYSLSAVLAKAAHRFRRARVPEQSAGRLADLKPPAWTFLHQPQDPRSATEIRARQT